MTKENRNDCPATDNNRSRVNNPHHRWLRTAVQIGFVIFSVFLCLEFRIFVLSLAAPGDGPVEFRPPSVEAYLPISSLMSLTYLVKTGTANRVHPAGLVIFTLTLALAMLIRRGFCSWVCPVGTTSEWTHKTGKSLFGRNLSMPKWLDMVLRSLKYLLLGFFIFSILSMSTAALQQFIYGPYNRIADIKMYLLFRNITFTTLIVIAVLAFLSLLFKNFFCRYLCPYGALLGLFSMFSPVAVRRDKNTCTGCGRCSRACPNRIEVDKKNTVRSAECTACFACIESCRIDGALQMGWPRTKIRLSLVAYGVITVGAFLFSAQLSRSLGYWHSETSDEMYNFLFDAVSQIDHP